MVLTRSADCGQPTLLLLNSDEQADIASEIEQKVSSIEDAPPLARAEMSRILHKHASVFSDAPGTIKNFRYQFKVREHTKFFVKPYVYTVVVQRRGSRGN